MASVNCDDNFGIFIVGCRQFADLSLVFEFSKTHDNSGVYFQRHFKQPILISNINFINWSIHGEI